MTKKFDLKRAIESSTGMLLDGIFGSEQIDSSGEILGVEGCDISSLDVDGVANWEHLGPKDEGHTPSQIVGRILYAKKIFKKSDCDSEREELYWDAVGEVPYIYGVIRLYDGAGHAAAADLAAQIRDAVANDETILTRYSIEGSTLKQEGNRLLKTVARKIAVTIKPCNRTAISGMLADPNAPEGFVNRVKGESDLLAPFQKDEHPDPNYTRLNSAPVIAGSPILSLGKSKEEPEDERVLVKFEIPGEEAFEFHQSGRGMGGAGRKDVYRGPPHNQGDLWLIKPSESKWGDIEPFRAAVQEAHSRVAEHILGPDRSHPVRVGTISGEVASLQPYIDRSSSLVGLPPENLTPEQAEDIASHHIVDWLMSNHDAHEENFIVRPDGRILGIDTEQSFRYANEDTLSADYHPNIQYGEREPYYNLFWRAFAEGRIDFDPRRLRPYIEAADRLPTDRFIKKLQPYMDLLRLDTDRRYAFVNMLAKRKEGLGETFRQFIEDLYRRRTGMSGTFDWEQGWVADTDMVKSLVKQKILEKAIAAGVGGAAPSTLTQGAALQKEDPALSKAYLVNQLKAALRDYNKNEHGDLREYLEDRLPEADQEFLDHFEELAGEYQLKKAQETLFEAPEPQKEATPKKKMNYRERLEARGLSEEEIVAELKAIQSPKVGKEGTQRRIVQRGQPLRVNPRAKMRIDPERGLFYTPYGTIKLNNPEDDTDPVYPEGPDLFAKPTTGRDAMYQALEDPETVRLHNEALDNWMDTHFALREGKIPDALIDTAAMFALLSANTPVPLQEYMFAHLWDTMQQAGLDPSHPDFASDLVRDIWHGKAKVKNIDENLPKLAHNHFRDAARQVITVTSRSQHDTGRKIGDLKAFSYPDHHWKSLSHYPEWRDTLIELVNKHNINGTPMVRDLMALGHKYHGKEGPFKNMTYGAKVKIARYIGLLLGQGDLSVPDVHYGRNVLGFDTSQTVPFYTDLEGKVRRYSPDKASLDYAIELLRERSNTELMEDLDRWYMRHPAVKKMLEHPKYGEYFRDNPDQARSPAFWLHWLAIPTYERHLKIGRPSTAQTGAAVHEPYWVARRAIYNNPNQGILTIDSMRRSESGALMSPYDAAIRLIQWDQLHGFEMANQLYWTFLVPRLWPKGDRDVTPYGDQDIEEPKTEE